MRNVTFKKVFSHGCGDEGVTSFSEMMAEKRMEKGKEKSRKKKYREKVKKKDEPGQE
ncbi:MAG: hypothetical protein IIZ39_05845 [Blautia sp.]|nr:hypothetical protein [Blautia sp.]